MDRHFRPPTPNRALAWALLSQSIWLPLLALDVHDRWQAQIRVQREIAEAASRRSPREEIQQTQLPSGVTTAASKQKDTGLLLGSATRSPLNPSDRTGMVSEAGLAGFAPTGPSHMLNPGRTDTSPFNPTAASGPGEPQLPRGNAPLGLSTTTNSPHSLLQTFNRAELLGGTLGLSDLNSPAMPPLAMAERARWQRSGDPLAPLPGAWREPMRRALQGLATSNGATTSVTAARVVHVPSLRVRHSTPVPLAVQPDGSVDILTKPDNPAVVDEIRQWSSRQPTSGQAGVTAAVVHLEPLPEAPREPQPAPIQTSTAAPIQAPVATNSRPAAAEPAVAPSTPPVAAAPAPEVTAPPPPAAASSASSAVPPGSETGASIP
ncbi:MAG: hypothetical protein RLZZ206_2985 [Cyanobacteriota bacterium]|jgi:hypothetical protein